MSDRLIGTGSPDEVLAADRIEEILSQSITALDVRGKRILLIVPDRTRTYDPRVLKQALRCLSRQAVRQTDVLIATGTHPPMSAPQIDDFFAGASSEFPEVRFMNHNGTDRSQLVQIGEIPKERISAFSRGNLDPASNVQVWINKCLYDYDLAIITGPVFPHEVVGMSGGMKYLFPGLSAKDMIDVSHWMSALVGMKQIIGCRETPVREMIETAGQMVPAYRGGKQRIELHSLCLVVSHRGLHGLYAGDPVKAQRQAAALAQSTHIRCVPEPYREIVVLCPQKYDYLWVAGKCKYKYDPVLAAGGELTIVAPHLKKIAPEHPDVMRVGYHCRDFFLKQWNHYRDCELSSLAHSVHVFGDGTYDADTKIERPAAKTIIAGGLSEQACREVNLGFRAAADVDLDSYVRRARAGESVLVIQEDAGELLYRLESDRQVLGMT